MNRRIGIIGVVMLAGIVSSSSPSAWAQDPIHKAGRGLTNLLTGWIEIPKQISLGAQAHNPLTGIGKGVLKGAGLTLVRGGLGLYEAATFPFPYPKGFASPYAPLELHDYAWEEEETSRVVR